MEGKKYIGITLDWDYKQRQVHLSMPGYVKRALQQLNHPYPTRQQDLPYPCAPIKYGAKIQYAKTPVDAQPVSAADKNSYSTYAEIPVLWKGSRQHYPNLSQRHRFTASQPNNRHYGQSETTSRLPCLIGQGNPDIFSKQHDIGSTQQRRLSK